VIYKGWSIHYCGAWPVTGQWRALRWGVRIGAGDKAALLRMIDAR
jgi:hypothetical protein